jgi:hypothetical protein
MTKRQIRNWVQRHPFIPFRVRTVPGVAYEVFHPDFMLLDDNARELTVWTRDRLRQDVNVLLISAIEQLPVEP